jgi:hypothetical protein
MVLTRCVRQLSNTITKYLRKIKLKNKQLVLAHSFRVSSPLAGSVVLVGLLARQTTLAGSM